jgi:dihydroorotase
MGSTTGDMLVDDEKILDKLFSLGHHLAVHAEDETIIRERLAQGRTRWGDSFPADQHAWLRPAQACVQAAKRAIALAQRHGTRLHLCHLSCQEELKLLGDKITSEVCLPHLWFTQDNTLGTRAKTNPAVKTLADRTALRQALASGQIECLATDHAPHLASEKDQPYLNAPSGLPSLECVLPLMLDLVHQDVLDLPTLVQRACAAPARIFGLRDRGQIAEGFHADLVLCDPKAITEVATIRSKAAWSPWSGTRFQGRVETVIVGGHVALQNGVLQNPSGAVLSPDFLRQLPGFQSH